MDYRFEGKRKTLSFGSYPVVSLKEARARRDDAKAKIANGIDPGAEKKRPSLNKIKSDFVNEVGFFSLVEHVSRSYPAKPGKLG